MEKTNDTQAEKISEFCSLGRNEGKKGDWPPSVSRDEPEKLSAETLAHTFFVRTTHKGILANIGVLDFMDKCPRAGDGKGVVLHRDVLLSLGHHLLDVVHELEQARKAAPRTAPESPEEAKGGSPDPATVTTPRYDPTIAELRDQLGQRDAEIKELRAALGEAAVKIRRSEQKFFR